MNNKKRKKVPLLCIFFTFLSIVFAGIYIGGFVYNTFISNIILLTGMVVLTAIAIWAVHLAETTTVKGWIKISAITAILFFQVIFTILFRTDNTWGWDFDTVVMLAKAYVNHTDMSYAYLARCSNNILYFWLVVGIFQMSKLISGRTDVILLLIFNVMILDISVFLIYRICAQWKNTKFANMVVLMCFLFVPFWVYLPIAYTDIFSMPLYILPVYLYTFYGKEEKTVKCWVTFFIMGLTGAVGLAFKGNTLIALVAISIFCFLNEKMKTAIPKIGIMCISFLTIYLLITSSYGHMSILREHNIQDESVPISHYIYMGMVGDGTWNADIFAETMEYNTHDEKAEYIKQRIREVTKDYGVCGLLKHIEYKESKIVWNDGMLKGDMYICREPRHQNAVWYIFQESNFVSICIKTYSNIYWKMLLTLMLTGGIIRIRKNDVRDPFTILYLILMGTILFFAFWESNSRYLLNAVPFMIMMAADTLWSLYEYFMGQKSILRKLQ